MQVGHGYHIVVEEVEEQEMQIMEGTPVVLQKELVELWEVEMGELEKHQMALLDQMEVFVVMVVREDWLLLWVE